jgi:outer membrane receptor protein involved in Fe transport
MNKFFTLLFLLLSISTFAQKGTIRGKIFESTTGEPAIGATVKLKNTNLSTFTDLDGLFSFDIDKGEYSISISYIGFKDQTVSEIAVEAGNVNVLDNIILAEDTKTLAEVVISAKMLRNNEESINILKKKAPQIMDGISSAKMRQIGDGTAVEAAKRVTGVTVEGGKYVYIRGLGDRYSKTTLNFMEVPGLDPDKNTIQMDIFPTSLIDNIMVTKTFTADLPADFSGGLLNVETKDFPDNKILDFSVNLGYNPSMHFNPNNLSYPGSSTDWLGFDNGLRKLPELAGGDNIPTPISGAPKDQVNLFIKSFNPNLAAMKDRSFMDFGFSFSAGNQFNLKRDIFRGGKFGYIFSVSYKSEERFYDEVTYGEYQKFIDPSVFNMGMATLQNGQLGEENKLIGTLAGIAFKSKNSKIRLTGMHLQNGEKKTGQFDINNNGEAVGQSGYIAKSDNLEYNQRSLSNVLLNGVHNLGNNNWEIDWRISPTLSISTDPDIRKTAFTFTPARTYFAAGAGGNPTRIWRYLNELNNSSKIDVSRKYRVNGQENKLRLGVSHTYKERDYEIKFFDVQFFGSQSWTSPDVSSVLNPENIYPNQPNSIYYQSGNNNPNPNQYNSIINNFGAYLSTEYNVNEKLKAIVGLRTEKFIQTHTGRDQKYSSGDLVNGKNLDNQEVLNTLNFFPSLNLIYKVNEQINLRGSYNKTVARPSFKEMSFAQILDPISNRIFNGSLFEYQAWAGNLIETDIDNVDVRLEKYNSNGEMISLSFFYKFFKNPIELVRIPEQQTSTEYQSRNVGNGNLFGLEFEFKKSLAFIMPSLKRFNLNGNVSLVNSRILMTDVEYNSRITYVKNEEVLNNTRTMAGQAPYVINGGLTYNNEKYGLDLGLFYNVKGETMLIVGAGLFPDIYTMPFHNTNFSARKKLGKSGKSGIDFKVSNFLNDKQEILYKSFQAKNEVFSQMNPGTTFNIGYSYKF